MIARIASLAGLVLCLATASAAAGSLVIGLDEAEIVRLDQPAGTIIVGNPAIADALVQSPELLVVTGKSYGSTNLIVLDQAGDKLAEFDLQVGGSQRNMVTVQRGANRYSYSCTPTCNSALVLGDQTETYQAVQQQVEGRIGLSRGQTAN